MGIAFTFEVLRAHRWKVLLSATLIAALACGFSLVTPDVYQARGRMLVMERPVGIVDSVAPALSEDSRRAAQAHAEMLASQVVAEQVVEQLDLDQTPQKFLEDSIVVNVDTQASILIVTAFGPSPERAAEIAETTIQVYRDLHIRRIQGLMDVAIAETESQLQDAWDRIQEYPHDGASDGSGNGTQVVVSDLPGVDAYDDLSLNLSRMIVAKQSIPGELVPLSVIPDLDGPVSMSTLKSALIGLIVGFLLSWSAIVVVTKFHDKPAS